MKLGYEGVFQVDIGAGEDGLVGCEEAPLAEVFEDVAEDCGFSELLEGCLSISKAAIE